MATTTAGTAAASVPALVPSPIPTKTSRYHTLRGKSVSSPAPTKAFEVFKDSDGRNDDDNTGTEMAASEEPPSERARAPSPVTVAARRRSKSMTTMVPPGASLAAAAKSTATLPEQIAALPGRGRVLEGQRGPSPAVPPPPIPTRDPPPVSNNVLSRKPANIAPSPLRISVKATNVDSPDKPDASQPNWNQNLAARRALNRHAARKNSDCNYTLTPTVRTTPSISEIERQAAERRRQEEQEAARWADEVARLEAETDRILAEQRKRDLARIRAHQQALTTPSPPSNKPRNLILGKLTIFSLGRKSNATSSPAASLSPTTPTVLSLNSSRPSSLEGSPSPSPNKSMNFIEQGGGGIVPQTDAPASASNGGERRVTVRCLSSTINLPVNTETSPVDILYSTANLTTHDIDPEACVVVECYVELGLERRLRRYEPVRDVMNSWDRDSQNSLLVLPCDGDIQIADLKASSVPRTEAPPVGFTLQLYHSSRPGKWTKRWITLLETGQMFASKKPDAKPSDKDSIALCHLSDFDIYTPRESEVRRHLKPPKKYCYAVKSQQKTFVFPNGENFVHFFSSEDGKVAERFYELIHGWRSWYLVNKKLDLQKKDKASRAVSRSATVKPGMTKSRSTVRQHKFEVSMDDTPYRLGNFSPLLDLGRFEKPLDEFDKDLAEQEKKKKASLEQQAKGLNRSRTLGKASRQPQAPLITTNQANEFSANGLLGNTYEKRKQAEQANPGSSKTTDGPFTEGPSLLNGGVTSPISPQDSSEPKSWFPSATEHTARTRSRSARNTNRRPTTADGPRNSKFPPQPLVNLSDTFPEPPNRRREAHGHGIKVPNGTPLINYATGGPGPLPVRGAPRAGSAVPASQSGMSSSSRPRSRSTVGMPHGRRMEDQPPVPPLPNRSTRRDRASQPVDQPRGRDPQPREPLINRAGTGTLR